jgi:lipopolysaccharide transport system ATP-binding protein
MSVIIASHLGKAFKQYRSKWSRLLEWMIPFGRERHIKKWVLQDLNFSIKAGEAVGIVGINGAGKSTLLKMITGTTQPTTGTVTVNGRVSALLELGMGFHPDFTGRENAIMAGQLLGYNTDEMMAIMPEIESFAEIGEYIDQPVRVYSSGMQMRLGFSVSTAYRPDILIVDEALSVGDTYFQHKSFERIRDYNKLGTTLLIVSHDKGAVQGICDRAILLSGGKLAMEGEPESVMDYYNGMLTDQSDGNVRRIQKADGTLQTVSGTGEATLVEAILCNEEGKKVEVVSVGQLLTIHAKVSVNEDLPELVFGYQIKDRLGQQVFGTNTYLMHQMLENVSAGEVITYAWHLAANIGEGTYSISFSLHNKDSHLSANYEWRDREIIFSVVNTEKPRFVGMAWLPSNVEYWR